MPHPSDGGYDRDMVSTDHMQKARIQKCHLVTYGGHTVSSVFWTIVARAEVIFLLLIIQLGDNSQKLLGFGALHFHLQATKARKNE